MLYGAYAKLVEAEVWLEFHINALRASLMHTSRRSTSIFPTIPPFVEFGCVRGDSCHQHVVGSEAFIEGARAL